MTLPFFEKALSPAEIRNVMHYGAANMPDLVAYYTFDDETANDTSGHQYHGQIIGQVQWSERIANPQCNLAAGAFLPAVSILESHHGKVSSKKEFVGDVNGDGHTDYLYYDKGWYVALGTDAGLTEPTIWLAASDSPTGKTYREGYQYVADMTGDGKVDILYFDKDGWYVAVSDGAKFARPARWLGAEQGPRSRTYNSSHQFVADLTGDGRADLLFNYKGWQLAVSTGVGLKYPQFLLGDYESPTQNTKSTKQYVADLNGDSKQDYMYFDKGWYVALSTETGFHRPELWLREQESPTQAVVGDKAEWVADVNGDGAADLVYYDDGWFVALSMKSEFAYPKQWLGPKQSPTGKTHISEYTMLSDVNQDGLTDLVFFDDGWHVALSTAMSFEFPKLWLAAKDASGAKNYNKDHQFIADVTGDGYPDLLVYQNGWRLGINDQEALQYPPQGTPSVKRHHSAGAFEPPVLWLANGSGPTGKPINKTHQFFADFTADGLDDYLYYDDGAWYLATSFGSAFGSPEMWLSNEQAPTGTAANRNHQFVADFTGDGVPDYLYHNNDGWYLAASNTESFESPTRWLDDAPTPTGDTTNTKHQFIGDFDADGFHDLLYRDEDGWYVARSLGASAAVPTLWLHDDVTPIGETADPHHQFVADLNGDGMDDYLFLRDDGWYALLSTGSMFLPPQLWLERNNSPSGKAYAKGYEFVADFNGDGMSDLAFRNNGWHVAFSTGVGFEDPLYWVGNKESPGGRTYDPTHQYVRDFNGDRMADLLVHYKGWYAMLSIGDGFAAASLWLDSAGPTGKTHSADYQHFPDVNGDGLPDLVYHHADGWYVALNDGSADIGETLGKPPVDTSKGTLANPADPGEATTPANASEEDVDQAGSPTRVRMAPASAVLSQGLTYPSLWLPNETLDRKTYSANQEFTADFNGDGKQDYLFYSSGWFVSLSTGMGFAQPVEWLAKDAGPSGKTSRSGYEFVADFNGDGMADLLYEYKGWHVAVSTGTSFEPPVLWLGSTDSPNGSTLAKGQSFVADFNGDSRVDYLFRNKNWYVALSTGSSFASPTEWLGEQGGPNRRSHRKGFEFVGDFNADGKADLLYEYGGWQVALSQGNRFAPPGYWLGDYESPDGGKTNRAGYLFVADYNGDGRDDLLFRDKHWHVAVSTGNDFAFPTLWLEEDIDPIGKTYAPGAQYIGDFNGDGLVDFSFYRTGWYVGLSTGTNFQSPRLWLDNNQSPTGKTHHANAYAFCRLGRRWRY